MSILGTTATIHLLDGRLDGVRTVESRTSPLRVHAAPWPELSSLLAHGLPASHGVYFLTRPLAGGILAARPGEASDLRRRLTEHSADSAKDPFAEVYAVSSVDARLSKSDCRYLEARAHEVIGQQPGRVLEVDKIPAVAECPAHERDVLETLFAQARTLLYAAGCRALDAPHLPFEAALPAEREDGLVEVRADGLASFENEDEHELMYDNCWARGHATADGGFIIRAGSDIRKREGIALLPGISNRRRFLAERGVLGSIPGVTDRWRLLAAVYCSSPLLAAKVATGAHLSRVIWQRISPSDRIVMAK
nr:hypothetical protein [uncultured Devosia sp.]